MENKRTEQQETTTKPGEILINLTEEQREEIRRRTGRLVAVLKVDPIEDRATPIKTYLCPSDQ